MKKIAIIGTCPSSKDLAPYDDDSWEIWGCSPAGMEMPRVDQWFELHRYIPGGVSFPQTYCDFLAKLECVVWTAGPVPQIPTHEILPVEELVDNWGPYYFTSSIAWMMAMAIEMNPEEIKLYGVDMAATTEYTSQRFGCHFFAQQAVMRGIKVSVPAESDLFCPAPLYGVCQSTQPWIKQTTKLKEYNSRLAEAQQQQQQASHDIAFLEGAKGDLDYNMQTWFGHGATNIGASYIRPVLGKSIQPVAPIGDVDDKIKELQVHESEHAETQPTSEDGDKSLPGGEEDAQPSPEKCSDEVSEHGDKDFGESKYPPVVT